jgi:hypothetical protein
MLELDGDGGFRRLFAKCFSARTCIGSGATAENHQLEKETARNMMPRKPNSTIVEVSVSGCDCFLSVEHVRASSQKLQSEE